MKPGKITMLSAFAVLGVLVLPSWAQVKELPKQTITVAGTVETIDQSKRAMNIKTADGKFVAVNVPESVKRFSELKVGDKVKATYNNYVIVRLKPAGEPAVDTADTSTTMGKTQWLQGGDGADDDGDHRRHRQERIVDHVRRAERMEVQPSGRRSDRVRSGQGGRQG